MARRYSAADPTANATVAAVMKSGTGRARPQPVRIHIVNQHCLRASGWQVGDILQSLGARPTWSSVHQAWVTTEAYLPDLVALLEQRGRDIEITAEGPR